MKTVFEFNDYKKFLRARVEEAARLDRGVRPKLAEVMGCQNAYISHVLAGEKNFSLEQAEGAARFFHLREDETDYFLLLVEEARAGTPQLRKYWLKQLQILRAQNAEIKNRIKIQTSVQPEDQATYYSSWHFQAVRTLLTIPGFKNADEIAERLNVDPVRIAEVLTFLVTKGLVEETAKGYRATSLLLHLPRTSPLINQMHTNWRVKTVSALDRKRPDDYHYSGLVTLAESDLAKVKSILMDALQSSIEVIKESKEEKLCLIAMDFFEL